MNYGKGIEINNHILQGSTTLNMKKERDKIQNKFQS